MRFSTSLAVAAAFGPLVIAHDGPSIPKIFGRNVRDLKSRDLFSGINARVQVESHLQKRHGDLQGRQDDRECGDGIGNCPSGQCCSEAGYCGTSADHCFSPGCDYAHGPACPENITPAGSDTSTVARPKVGNVLYGGAGVYECVTEGTIALTYDDGPLQQYTDHILDLLDSYNAKATFFITGNNIGKGQIDTTPALSNTIKRMASAGHQIASHTWTHLDLSAISRTDRRNQMVKNEMALRNIVGFFPTYMRPPYSSCTPASGCESDLADLGYHVIYFDVDTDDYNQATPGQIQKSKDWFRGNITAGGSNPQDDQWLAIAHDIHEQTAYNLTEFMLSTLTNLGYRAVTVGECLGDPKENWYRSSLGTEPQPTGTTSVSLP